MPPLPPPVPDSDPSAVQRLVAMLHVVDVSRSVAFYRHLGLVRRGEHRVHGQLVWAHLGSAPAELFLARASGPIDAAQQAVLLYLYSDDLAGLHRRLLAAGLHAAPPFDPEKGPPPTPPLASGRVYPIVPRFYMPAGELRVEDPDGYVLLVGQLD
jgi:hypothetical protein